MLTVTPLANHFNVAPDSIRRWSKTYARFLSKGANPAHGFERKYSRHDAAILLYVHTQRHVGLLHREIEQRLTAMQADDWSNLPPVPDEWFLDNRTGLITISAASDGAATLAELAVVQVEAETMRVALQEAEQRAASLQLALDHEKSQREASEVRVHALELDLEKARGEVNALKSQVEAFTLAYGMGRDKPLPIAAIIAVTAVAAVVLVLVVLVVVRLVL